VAGDDACNDGLRGSIDMDGSVSQSLRGEHFIDFFVAFVDLAGPVPLRYFQPLRD
jgi:hypothetical protein